MANSENASEPDLSDDSFGLDPNYTPEEIQRIQTEAIQADGGVPDGDTQDRPADTQVPETQVPQSTKKRKQREKMISKYWQYFTKGETREDGFYDAKCNFCGHIYDMGNGRGTGSLMHHFEKACKKVPKSMRQKPNALQKLLQAGTTTAPAIQVWAFDQMKCRKGLARMALCLVLDGSSANEACIKEMLSGPIMSTLPANGQIFHQRCGCHILNLIVQDGLDVLDDEIKTIREAMKYIRHSQSRMEKFKRAVAQVKAPDKKPAWDVQTRWNSTYLMLQLAFELREAIERFAILDKNSNLVSHLDWDKMKALLDCLKVFYEATLKLSGTKYPTLNLFFPEFCEVCLSIKKMRNSNFSFIVDMSLEMYAKWDKYWTGGNMLLAIACVFDPRSKLGVVEYYIKEMYPNDYDTFMANLNTCINALFKDYEEAYNRLSHEQVWSSSQQVRQSSSASARESETDTRAGLKDYLKNKKRADPKKSELEEYLSDALDENSLDVEFDILSWWRLKAAKYPILSRLTRDILAVPISTVASESTFSNSGRTLSPIRSSLNDESIEALICTQDWLRASVTGTTKLVETLVRYCGLLMKQYQMALLPVSGNFAECWLDILAFGTVGNVIGWLKPGVVLTLWLLGSQAVTFNDELCVYCVLGFFYLANLAEIGKI
ncbi:hypothetical protein LUZ63_019968 [Rhynchospora breviuscula]|uniref:BED-type domain-containing protein n=1 Tax=Rhynchospora breviuscula TaxID=2022672 RepID=A0A9Q0C792_9POAL|nr:hypothetical protein LUZ63_019968 [Rhynchospora breviuscula]